jgi:hypothetical protein
MAIRWIRYDCTTCRWSLELPRLWATCRRALSCNFCGGRLQRVPPVPTRRRRATA